MVTCAVTHTERFLFVFFVASLSVGHTLRAGAGRGCDGSRGRWTVAVSWVYFFRLTVGRWQTSTVAHKIFVLRNFLTFTRIFTHLTQNVHERANFGQIRVYGLFINMGKYGRRPRLKSAERSKRKHTQKRGKFSLCETFLPIDQHLPV